MDSAKEILKDMYLKEYFKEKQSNDIKYVKFKKSELINFCLKLINTIEENTNGENNE